MSVYKEAYFILAAIATRSHRIYEDACDFGAPVKIGDPLWNNLKYLASFMVEGTREENRYSTGRSVSMDIELMDEWGGQEHPTEYFHLEFVSCTTGKCKGYDGYVNLFPSDSKALESFCAKVGKII